MDNAGLVVIPLIVACSTFGAANAGVFVVGRYTCTNTCTQHQEQMCTSTTTTRVMRKCTQTH